MKEQYYLSVTYFLDRIQDNTKIQIRNCSDKQLYAGNIQDFYYNENRDVISEKEVDCLSVSMSNELIIVIKD